MDTACWTPATDAVACLLAGSTTATTPDPLDTGWTLLWADAVWASNHQDRSAARTPGAPTPPRTGLATAATSAAGGTPPSSWRLGALLSSDDFGRTVERDGGCHVLWQRFKNEQLLQLTDGARRHLWARVEEFQLLVGGPAHL